MAKYYFFKTEKDTTGKIRVLPLPNQKDATGMEIKTTIKVSCSKNIRSVYTVGSIFVGDSVLLSKKGCYTTKNFRKLKTTMTEAVKEYETLTGTKYADPDDKTGKILDAIISDKSLKAPTSSEDGFFMSTDDWRLLVRNIKKHINTMIIGPTGSGKTSCVKEVCDRMGIELHIFDMGSMIDPISSLLGVHRLEAGKSVFDYAKFTEVIQRPCVILLDELNRASLSCNNVLFPCLDDRRKLSIEIACGKGKREINVHPEVTFIATANIGSEYSGTNTMDRALVNRFFPLELGCIPSKEESAVLTKRTGVEPKTSDLIVTIANNIRSLANKEEISVSLSIRETLMVANLVSDGWDLGKAMEMIYLPLYEGTKTDGERSTVYKTISTY